MSESEIKSIVQKYKRKAGSALMIMGLFAIALNWYLVDQSIERHAALDIPYSYSNEGFILVVLIVGLSAVFHSCVNIIEKVLVELFNKKTDKPE
jgi:hypothetical protein